MLDARDFSDALSSSTALERLGVFGDPCVKLSDLNRMVIFGNSWVEMGQGRICGIDIDRRHIQLEADKPVEIKRQSRQCIPRMNQWNSMGTAAPLALRGQF